MDEITPNTKEQFAARTTRLLAAASTRTLRDGKLCKQSLQHGSCVGNSSKREARQLLLVVFSQQLSVEDLQTEH